MSLPLLLSVLLGLVQGRSAKFIISLFRNVRGGSVNFFVQRARIGTGELDVGSGVGFVVGRDMGLNVGPSDEVWFANTRR